MLSGQAEGAEYNGSGINDDVDGDGEEPVSGDRSQHTAPKEKHRPGKHIDGYNALDEMDDESDAPSSGNGWDSGVEDEADDQADDDDEDEDEDEDEEPEMTDNNDGLTQEQASEDGDDGRSLSLVVSLRYSKTGSSPLSRDATNGASALKQVRAAPAPTTDQTDLTNSLQDVPKAVRSKLPNDDARPDKQAPEQLPPTFLPTTTLPPISPKTFNEYTKKIPVSLSDAGTQQPPLNTALRPTLAPSPDTGDNGDPYPSFQELQPPKGVEPAINFQQYQYQPPAQ